MYFSVVPGQDPNIRAIRYFELGVSLVSSVRLKRRERTVPSQQKPKEASIGPTPSLIIVASPFIRRYCSRRGGHIQGWRYRVMY